MSAEYSVDKVVAGREEVDDIHLRIGINQLDAEGFENVYSVYIDMLSDVMENLALTQDNPEQAKAMMEQQMALIGIRLLSEVEKLLKKDLQIEMTDLRLTLPAGEVKGDFPSA